MRSVLKIGVVLAMMIAVVGCGSPPQAELDAAQAALDTAKTAGADVYAPEAYNRASNTLSDAKAKVDDSDYETAKSLAIQAKDLYTPGDWLPRVGRTPLHQPLQLSD